MSKVAARVVASGVLRTFNDIPCYVLEDGQRIFRLSSLNRALRGKEHGNHGKFGNYLAASVIQKYLPERLRPLKDSDNDRVPQGVIKFNLNGKIEKGYNSEDFMDVCSAFVTANLNNEQLTQAQKEIVKNANAYILACAKVGITALIDEATGFQDQREDDELQRKFNFFLNGTARDWEKTFPDELWIEFGRLTNWRGSIKERPRYWGNYVNDLIYKCIDEDVAQELKKRKSEDSSDTKLHQFLNKDRGIKILNQHIWQIIGMAKTCSSITELKKIADKEFKKNNTKQISFFS